MKENIRTDHFVLRKSIREIARERHLSRRTIRAALRDASPTTYNLKNKRPEPVIEPVKAFIAQILSEDQARPTKQRHTAHRIFERLRDECQFTGAESTIRRHVRQQRGELPEVFIPLEFDPGIDAQVDWGVADVIMNGTQREVQMFCFKLRASGAIFVACFPCQKQEALFEAHVQAFEFFGGVPKRLTYDNLTTAVKRVLTGSRRQEQEAFTAFRSHHLFESHFCTPGLKGAHEKGGVEHLVGYARRNFLVPLPEVDSFDELNRFLAVQCLSNRERHMPGSELTIAEALNKEHAALRSLPTQRYECCRRLPVKADSYARVSFESNYYSVPVEHAHRKLTLKAFANRIELVLVDQVIARHLRQYGRQQEIFDPMHYLPLLLQRPGAFNHAKPIRRWHWPPIYDRYLATLREYLPDNRGTREFIRILQLHAEFSSEMIEVAMSLALEYRAYSYDSLKNLLTQLKSEAPVPRRLDLSERQTLATIRVGDFRTDQYNLLLTGGER